MDSEVISLEVMVAIEDGDPPTSFYSKSVSFAVNPFLLHPWMEVTHV